MWYGLPSAAAAPRPTDMRSYWFPKFLLGLIHFDTAFYGSFQPDPCEIAVISEVAAAAISLLIRQIGIKNHKSTIFKN